MIIDKFYKVSWKHYDRNRNLPLTMEELEAKITTIIETNRDKFSAQRAIKGLFISEREKIVTKSHSKCIIEKLYDDKWVTVSVGLGIVHPNDNFDRKRGVLESFKDAVNNIGRPNLTKEEKEGIWSEEQMEEEKQNRYIRSLLWEGFWKSKESKPKHIKLYTERDRNLRVFLEETASKEIKGKSIIYTISKNTEIYFPRND